MLSFQKRISQFLDTPRTICWSGDLTISDSRWDWLARGWQPGVIVCLRVITSDVRWSNKLTGSGRRSLIVRPLSSNPWFTIRDGGDVARRWFVGGNVAMLQYCNWQFYTSASNYNNTYYTSLFTFPEPATKTKLHSVSMPEILVTYSRTALPILQPDKFTKFFHFL